MNRDALLARLLESVERGRVPDVAVRWGIRQLCRERLKEEGRRYAAGAREALGAFLAEMRSGPIAPVPEKANEQHYELPPEFFGLVLGARRKYSCCYWTNGVQTLDDAEAASLAMTAQRAQLSEGQDILELGCGWGSLTLWMAEHYPGSRITAVSNSAPQRRYIEEAARVRGFSNVRVFTADMNAFETAERFDRVVSVEMFEHMHNYALLLGKIRQWLRPSGKLFIHIFCHRTFVYRFETEGAHNWMGRYFFTGGIMPSYDLLLEFPGQFTLAERWWWSGTHYEKTSNAWLALMDARRESILPILARAYGAGEAERWFMRWRVFFMAVAEMFGYRRGEEWGVGHYLLDPAREP
jgi:cyclopropane-fatty-acyl-phospholipid synthase